MTKGKVATVFAFSVLFVLAIAAIAATTPASPVIFLDKQDEHYGQTYKYKIEYNSPVWDEKNKSFTNQKLVCYCHSWSIKLSSEYFSNLSGSPNYVERENALVFFHKGIAIIDGQTSPIGERADYYSGQYSLTVVDLTERRIIWDKDWFSHAH